MKLEILSREELFSSTIRSEFFEVKGDGVTRLKEILCSYDNVRLSENYTQEHVNKMIDSGRFAYGAVITYLNDSPVCFCGLDLFNGWVSVARHISFKYFKMPFSSGEMLPFVFDKVRHEHNGLMFTFNESNKTMFDMVSSTNGRYNRRVYDSIRDHQLFIKAETMTRSIQKISNLVTYRDTAQYIAYITDKNKPPQF